MNAFGSLTHAFSAAGLEAVELFAGDGAICDLGDMPAEEVVKLLTRMVSIRRAGARPEVTVVRLGEGPLRSGSAAELSLHQEDYHLDTPPELVFLYCEETDGHAGATTVASSRKLVDPGCQVVTSSWRIRFLRSSGGVWTPWRDVIQHTDRGPVVRLAFPDVHRRVELAGVDGHLGATMVTAVGEDVHRLNWRPGLLLGLNNLVTLHGRERIVGDVRRLLRVVFR